MVRDEVLRALEAQRGQCISGAALAQTLGVSRAAVWKAIEKLRADGLAIDALAGEGYALRADDDTLTAEAVQAALVTHALGRALTVVPETDSTNSLMKRAYADAPHGFTLIARTQTAGRGRLGRTFCSPDGGLYLSVLLRPRLPLGQLNLVTLAAAVAVCRALERLTPLAPAIKWVNDVLVDERKLCGILTEAAIEGETGAIDFVVVGIGVNLRLDRTVLPPDVQEIACALADLTRDVPRRAVLAAAILGELETRYALLESGQSHLLLAEYRTRLCVLGRTVRVCAPQGSYEARVQDLDENGHLLVRTPDGAQHTLSSGEISIRL